MKAKRKNEPVGTLKRKDKPGMDAVQPNEPMGNASKPVSFHPLRLDKAVAALLKVKPPAKE